MDRRKFLRNGSVAGLTISTIAAGCGVNNAEAKQPVESNTQTPFKDDFVLNEVTIDVLNKNAIWRIHFSINNRQVFETY